MVTALLLLVLSGFVSASETSFFSLSPEELKHISEDESLRCRKASGLLSDSERLLATILTANNLINVALILLLDLALKRQLDAVGILGLDPDDDIAGFHGAGNTRCDDLHNEKTSIFACVVL